MTRIIMSTLLVLVLLAGCGSAPAPDTTGSQASTPATSEAATAEASPPPVAATTTSSPEQTATETEQTSSLDLIAALTRSGGLQGRTQTLLVRQDGTLTLQNGEQPNAVFSTGRASEAQLQSLRSLLASDEWQQLDATYGRQSPDAFMYTVIGGGVRITTYDGAPNPPALENVLAALNELWQAAQ